MVFFSVQPSHFPNDHHSLSTVDAVVLTLYHSDKKAQHFDVFLPYSWLWRRPVLCQPWDVPSRHCLMGPSSGHCWKTVPWSAQRENQPQPSPASTKHGNLILLLNVFILSNAAVDMDILITHNLHVSPPLFFSPSSFKFGIGFFYWHRLFPWYNEL